MSIYARTSSSTQLIVELEYCSETLKLIEICEKVNLNLTDKRRFQWQADRKPLPGM